MNISHSGGRTPEIYDRDYIFMSITSLAFPGEISVKYAALRRTEAQRENETRGRKKWSVYAVSYTHLDVYKRQHQAGAPTQALAKNQDGQRVELFIVP